MDRREAIQELTQWRDQMKSHGVPNYGKKLTALDLAIKALKDDTHSPMWVELATGTRELSLEEWQEIDRAIRGDAESATTTCKLKNPCDSLLKADSDECKEQKSKLESEQMREYIPKDEVLDIIESMPVDLVEEYVYELDGIWLDDDEEKLQLSPETSTNDLISRQQAIEAVEGVDWYHVNSKGELVHGSTSDEESWYRAEDVYKAIETLPLVTPTERTIDHDKDWIIGCIKHDGFINTTRGDKANQIILDAVQATERTGEWIRRKDGGATCSRCGVMLGKGHWTNCDGIPDYYCYNCGAKMGGDTE